MTEKEFYFQVERLKKCFGDNQFPEERVLTIFKIVQDLDAKWFQKIVTSMIVSMNSRLDFLEASRNERHQQAAKQFTSDVSAAFEKLSTQMTDHGFKTALGGANSLVEAVEKSKDKK